MNDYLETIEFLNRKIHQLDEKVRRVVESDKYAKLLMTVPGISYCPLGACAVERDFKVGPQANAKATVLH